MSNDVKWCLNILRRTPPSDVVDNLERLIALRVDLDEELCQRVDTPLELAKDTQTGKRFILCDYNRDGDSHRSPWSNQYFPPIMDEEEGFKPSSTLRELEVEANKVFDVYRKLYFEGGVSSVYMWDLDDGGFAACFCIQKDAEGDKNLKGFKGSWSSVHVFEVSPASGGKDMFDYKLTSTVLVSMPLQLKGLGDIDLSGSITKQKRKLGEKLKSIGENKQSHLEVMGPLLEDLELDLRNTIEGVYFQKTKEIINGMRVTDSEIRERNRKLADLGKSAAGGKS